MLTRLRSRPAALVLGTVLVVASALAFGVVRQGDDDQVRLTGEVAGTTTTVASSTATPTSTTTTAAVSTTTAPGPTSSSTRPPPTTLAPAAASPPVTRGTSVTAEPSPPPPFQSSVQAVTAEQLGASWRPGIGCPAPDQLRLLVVSHWGYDRAVHQGRLVVAASHADRIVAAFRDLYAARFPIQRMVPVDAYGGDDQASMRANNTSGFNCRYVAGTTRLSQHGLGLAVDVNPLVNPYVRGRTVDPPEGAPYADRSRREPGMIRPGDAAVTAFAAQGWQWGGFWTSGQDYQHFSANGR